MNSADFVALAPYLVVAVGILLLLLVISYRRNTLLVVAITVLVMLVSLMLTGAGIGAPAHRVAVLLLIDGYSSFLNGLFLLAGIVTALLARGYLQGRGGEQEEFFLLLLLATLGAMVMTAASHFAAFLMGLEILSVSLYVMIGYSEEGHPPLEAALKYLVLSGVASTTMLFGFALVYIATGTMDILAISERLPATSRAELYLLMGHGLLFAGIAFKLSLVPFHMWTPDVYQGAPAPVSGFLATVSKGAVFAFLLRYALVTDVLAQPALFKLIGVIAGLSMIGGNLLALLQDNVKRMLGYSSVAHLGYLLVGLLAVVRLSDQTLAVEASMIYLAGYFLMTLAAFGVVTVLSSPLNEVDAESIEAFGGLFWRRPLSAVVMAVALLSLTGIPLTAGFIVKFYLLTAGVEGGMWLLLWLLVIGSAIAVYYYLRVILTMAQSAETEQVLPVGRVGSMSVLSLIGVSLILFGVYPAPLIEVVRTALGISGG
jgi:NADH-quinone oxidoreductase subunit N